MPLICAVGLPTRAFGQPTSAIWQEGLGNGMTVIVEKDDSFPLVAIELVIKGGSSAELPGERGAAHFVEHMVFRATRGDAGGLNEQDLGEAVEGLGGQIDAGTLRDFTHCYMTVLDSHWEEALQRLAQAVRKPAFLPQEVEAERRVILAEAQELTGRGQQVLADALFGVAFAGHPYEGAPWGSLAGLSSIAPDALEEYWKRVYLPRNTLLVIVGKVEREKAVAAARSSFGDWSNGEQGAGWELPVAALPGPGVGTDVTLPSPGETSLAGVGFVVPGAGQWEEVAGLDVLYAMLGRGAKSRLIRGVSEQVGDLVGVGCEYLTQRGPGLFYVWAEVQRGQGKEAVGAILTEIAKVLQEVPQKEEVDRARRIVKGSYAFSTETLVGKAKALGFYAALGDARLASDYGKYVDNVTPEDIYRLCKRYLDLTRRVVVVME